MRLHRLEIQAFGSFPRREVIDFDELSEAGLFLVHGDTGAGKTTILDAVAFALYGEVPGARGKGSLRSDHAAADTRTEVVLEATLGSRRVRIRRTPAQERPKKRGTGTVVDQPTVLFSEQLEGDWGKELNRLDEVGMRVKDMLGLGAPQFCQVAMLPQGGFAKFLIADAKDRKELLEDLFDTSRFNQVEAWLSERERDLWADLRSVTDAIRAIEGEVERHLATSEAGVPIEGDIPGPGGSDRTASVGTDGAERDLSALPAWVQGHLDLAAGRAEDRQTELLAARAERDAAAADDRTANELAKLQERHRLASRRLDELLAGAEEHSAHKQSLATARRAAPIGPLLAELETRRDFATSSVQEMSERWAAVRALVGERQTVDESGAPALAALGSHASVEDPVRAFLEASDHHEDPAGRTEPGDRTGPGAGGSTILELVDRAIEEATRVAERVDSLAELSDQIASSQAEVARRRAQAGELDRLISQLDERAGQIPALIESAQAALDDATSASARLDGLRSSKERSEAVLGAVRTRDAHIDEITSAKLDLEARRSAHREAADRVLTLRERRLDQIAAELAQNLAPGEACQVCGSPDHPAPADAGADGLVSPADIESAQRTADSARTSVSEAEATIAGLEGRIEAAEEQAAGATLDESELRVGEAATALSEAEALAGCVDDHRSECRRLREEQSDLDDRLSAVREERARELAAADQLEVALAEQVSSLETGLGPHPNLSSLRSSVLRRREVLDRCRRATQTALQARGELASVHQRIASALVDGGFAHLDELRAALLPTAQITALEERVETYEKTLATLESIVADPDMVAAAEADPPDLEGSAARRLESDRRHDEATAAAARASDSVSFLTGAAARLDEHLEGRGPLADEHATVERLARLTAGTSPDNAFRMRLGTYVLAAILEEVTDAANAHLARMSSDRYAFLHSDTVTDGRKQAGLGLVVHDAWAETVRDASTLSGGESFFASLALALGLAEVVTNAAGGIRIDTLFIDEGFGSLDEATLGDVMDTLDSLRDGGRTIGVVSHVAAMRDRIQAHVQVTKTSSGSTITTSVGQPI